MHLGLRCIESVNMHLLLMLLATDENRRAGAVARIPAPQPPYGLWSFGGGRTGRIPITGRPEFHAAPGGNTLLPVPMPLLQTPSGPGGKRTCWPYLLSS